MAVPVWQPTNPTMYHRCGPFASNNISPTSKLLDLFHGMQIYIHDKRMYSVLKDV